MDKLNIDFQSLLPYVIDAFTAIFGEEYRSIISSKVNNAFIIYYHDLEGLDDYLSYLKRCKAREFAMHFLDEISIDVQDYKKRNYTEYLDDEIEDILQYYIGHSFLGFAKSADYWSPLRAFNSSNNSDAEQLFDNKLKIINYLLGSEDDHITKESFDTFVKTERYSELLERINRFNLVYERLLSQYNDWAVQLQPYEKYVEDEKKRKESILQKKKDELFDDIISKIPLILKKSIVSKTLKEQQDAILGSNDISFTSLIEYFRHEKMEELMSSEVSLTSKRWIVYRQSKYFNNLGVTISNENMLNLDSEEDVVDYLNFLEQDSIKRYIPSDELINYISSTRERKYEEALMKYYISRKDFTDIIKMFDDNPYNFGIVYNNIKNKMVCILGQGAINDNNEFISLMFYTIRAGDGGYLFYSLIHEFGHVIDQSRNGSGFETWDDLINENCEKNPYNKTCRKYEMFNETLDDIFIREAIEYLQNKGFYLIEPIEFTSFDTINRNTSLLIKKLLYPLVEKFREQVIKAKISAKREELVKCIGKINFENLVDAVNKVDYLARNGVVFKIEESPEDPMVKEYYEQVERVKQIYISIDEFYANNYKSQSTNNENSVNQGLMHG